jgi:hypothetical protein
VIDAEGGFPRIGCTYDSDDSTVTVNALHDFRLGRGFDVIQ